MKALLLVLPKTIKYELNIALPPRPCIYFKHYIHLSHSNGILENVHTLIF